jgi:DNA-binding response OmpR family regulator
MSSSLSVACDAALLRPLHARTPRVALQDAVVTGGSQPHVLVIDEEPEILDLVRELLEGEGFAVSTRQWTTPDLREIKARRPDLIILDSLLPFQAGGDSLFQLLKRDQETLAIPLVLCSGEPCELAAADLDVAVIPKPFDIADFVAIIHEALHPRQRSHCSAQHSVHRSFTPVHPRVHLPALGS